MPVVNVLNRYSEPVEIQFDAAFNPESPYRWAPGEVKALPQAVAVFCRSRSAIKSDPITGKDVRALVIQGIDKEYEQYVAPLETEEQPPALLPHRGAELLDRTHMNPRDQAITLLSLVNPTLVMTDRQGVASESHARRVLEA